MPDPDLVNEILEWTPDEGSEFPLDDVIAAFRRVGKHFVAPELLAALTHARETLSEDDTPLRRFLDTALDKHDGRFDNPSYLALHDLPLPTTSGRCPLDTADAERHRDRLTTLLVADLLRFELAALKGTTDLLPLIRPDARTVGKRCTLGIKALKTTLPRLGIYADTGGADAIEAAQVLCDRIEATTTVDERRMLAVTMPPVYTAHDEYLFVRMLQCYETSFSLVAIELRAAIIALKALDAERAVRALGAAARIMDDCTPFFSIVATMQPEAFTAFREYTDGASAIQSRSYRTIESLCRRPDPERLFGPGYDAVPDVRVRVLAGQPTLAEVLEGSSLSPHEHAAVQSAMAAFEAEIMGWRRTHYSIATRMLGMRRGTGYTSGVPYLAETKDAPVFGCPFGHGKSMAA